VNRRSLVARPHQGYNDRDITKLKDLLVLETMGQLLGYEKDDAEAATLTSLIDANLAHLSRTSRFLDASALAQLVVARESERRSITEGRPARQG